MDFDFHYIYDVSLNEMRLYGIARDAHGRLADLHVGPTGELIAVMRPSAPSADPRELPKPLLRFTGEGGAPLSQEFFAGLFKAVRHEVDLPKPDDTAAVAALKHHLADVQKTREWGLALVDKLLKDKA